MSAESADDIIAMLLLYCLVPYLPFDFIVPCNNFTPMTHTQCVFVCVCISAGEWVCRRTCVLDHNSNIYEMIPLSIIETRLRG